MRPSCVMRALSSFRIFSPPIQPPIFFVRRSLDEHQNPPSYPLPSLQCSRTATHKLTLIHTDRYSCEPHRGLTDPVIKIAAFGYHADHSFRSMKVGVSYPCGPSSHVTGWGRLLMLSYHLFSSISGALSRSVTIAHENLDIDRIKRYTAARPFESEAAAAHNYPGFFVPFSVQI